MMQHLVALADYIVGKISAKYEPESSLMEINQILSDRFDELWSIIKEDKVTKLEFYKKVLKLIADKLLSEKLIESPSVIRFIINHY